ncbi:MAG: helix-turn-helix transcriptional regulator [Bacteroidales bacterium]|nr:helix-turn-helix transcriptional regulator [Bacteroidales bacterium]
MAHNTTVKWINAHLEQVGKALIAACGDQMGIDARFRGPDCRRKDAVVFRTEQTVRYRHPEPDRFGGEKTAHFRNDGVFYVRPGLWGLNAVPSRLMAFTVGVEIKEQLSDLRGDKKDMYYLGWTDFYFFLVPAGLEEAAREKLAALDDARFGLLVYGEDKCSVVIAPLRQQVPPANQYALALQAVFSDTGRGGEVDIDWNGIPEDGAVDVGAWLNACRGLHPEFAGGEDTVIEAMWREEERKPSLGAACDRDDASPCGDQDSEAQEKRTAKAAKATARKAAKQAREAALLEELASVPAAEIRRRLVSQTNDTQSVYHALRRMADDGGTASATAAQIADAVGVSRATVENSLRALREADLIRSSGSRKKPSILLECDVQALHGFTDRLLLRSVKSPRERRRMALVCRECAFVDCSAHPPVNPVTDVAEP